jgi:hypothetical protein
MKSILPTKAKRKYIILKLLFILTSASLCCDVMKSANCIYHTLTTFFAETLSLYNFITLQELLFR